MLIFLQSGGSFRKFQDGFQELLMNLIYRFSLWEMAGNYGEQILNCCSERAFLSKRKVFISFEAATKTNSPNSKRSSRPIRRKWIGRTLSTPPPPRKVSNVFEFEQMDGFALREWRELCAEFQIISFVFEVAMVSMGTSRRCSAARTSTWILKICNAQRRN